MSDAGRYEEEVRLALVLNGGVSLAIWMGGVTCELDRARRAGFPALRDLEDVGVWADVCEVVGHPRRRRHRRWDKRRWAEWCRHGGRHRAPRGHAHPA